MGDAPSPPIQFQLHYPIVLKWIPLGRPAHNVPPTTHCIQAPAIRQLATVAPMHLALATVANAHQDLVST